MFFFLNDTAPTEIYPLPLHDPLPIFLVRLDVGPADEVDAVGDGGENARDDLLAVSIFQAFERFADRFGLAGQVDDKRDRKSTRLNSSHLVISYAVFCLKKKKNMVEVSQTTCTLRFQRRTTHERT